MSIELRTELDQPAFALAMGYLPYYEVLIDYRREVQEYDPEYNTYKGLYSYKWVPKLSLKGVSFLVSSDGVLTIPNREIILEGNEVEFWSILLFDNKGSLTSRYCLSGVGRISFSATGELTNLAGERVVIHGAGYLATPWKGVRITGQTR